MVKRFFKSKWFILAIIIIVLIIASAILIFNISKKDDTKKELKENTYTMYVSINPLVKLTYKESYYECIKGEKKSICGEEKDEVIDYKLLNKDAKKIYENIDFKGKTLEESVILLIKEAKSNKINTDEINIISDMESFNKEEFKKNINDKLESEVSFDVMIEKDVTDAFVFEKVNIKYYTVKFDSDGGSTIQDEVVISKENATIPSVPTKSGYEFVEWQLNNKKYDFNKEVTKDITLKAKWKKVSETVGNEDEKNNETVQKQEKLTCVAGDKEMPKPDNLKISPSKITVGKSVTATVHITDQSGVKNAWVRFDNTTGTVASIKLKLKSGTLQDGIFTGTVKIPSGQPAGTWKAVVIVSDPCGSIGDNPLTQEIVAVGSITDNVKPDVKVLSVTPSSAKVGDKVTVQFNASDLSGISEVHAQLNSRNNSYQKAGKVTLISGDKNDGVYTVSFDITAGHVDGKWTISIIVKDKYGNVTVASNYLNVSGGISDNKPPVISVSSLSSTSLNRGDTLTVKINGTDETGIKDIYCGLNIQKVYIKLSLESGTNKNGIYVGNIIIPADTTPGAYYLYCNPKDVLENSNHNNNLASIMVN